MATCLVSIRGVVLMENVERPYPSNGNQNDNFLSSKIFI